MTATLTLEADSWRSLSAQEPYYRYDLPFTPKPIVLNKPFSCVADKRADIAFFGEANTEEVYSRCTVEKEPISPFQLRITVLGKKADVTSSTAFALVHLWYQVVQQNDGMLVLSGDTSIAHVMITIDLKPGAFVYTGAAWAGGQVSVTSSWGRCQND